MLRTVEPSWLITPEPPVIFVGFAFLPVVFILSSVGWNFDNPIEALTAGAIGAVISLAIYAALLRLYSRGDPRLWLDKPVFDRYVAALTKDEQVPAAEEIDYARAIAWRDGTVVLAQQSGAAAGSGAAVPLIANHWIAATFVFLIVMLFAGLATRRLLERRDKTAMEAILAAYDRETPPEPA